MSVRRRYPYGFRVWTFSLEQARERDSEAGPETVPLLPLQTESAKGMLLGALQVLQTEGLKIHDQKQHRIVEIHDATAQGFILLKIEGGRAGSKFTVKDERGQERGEVREEDSLVWPGRVLIAFSSNDARQGFMVHETYSGRTHSEVTRLRLYAHLLARHNVSLHTAHDLADNMAWDQVLKDDAARIEEIEFTVKAPDDVTIGEDTRPRKMSVAYQVEPAPVERFLRKGSRTSVTDLVNSVGSLPHPDSFEEGEAVVEIATAHGTRRLQIGRRPYPFTRLIKSPYQVDDVEFLHEVTPDLLELAARLDMALPQPFLPTDSLRPNP
ncbi:hypothetical protein F1529_17315 [Alcanivorax sp. VBW004]|uniref:Uncharacterized protein n=1 Tax=Micrococcus luteus TaxID=1270 RepID=A0AAP3ESK1_MICLU|nr:hypothetical protein [Alcanivorax sp. VBW004]MCV7584148.1 hypothetical protein [Micrococcus luteus]MCV7588805.1 hypothetical protein [Micrococcus luteus]MCV7629471.1 hypothetical protein [Micrococcus luteus]MTT54240.1 hypothetical protein [Alcanivorax sp. VBW004]